MTMVKDSLRRAYAGKREGSQEVEEGNLESEVFRLDSSSNELQDWGNEEDQSEGDDEGNLQDWGNEEGMESEEEESSDRSLDREEDRDNDKDKDELEKKALKIFNQKLASTHRKHVSTTSDHHSDHSDVVKTLNRMNAATDVVSSISGTKVTRESIPNSILIIPISILYCQENSKGYEGAITAANLHRIKN